MSPLKVGASAVTDLVIVLIASLKRVRIYYLT